MAQKLSPKAAGLSLGIVIGVCFALMTLLILVGYMEPKGGLEQIYGILGFSYSIGGIFLALIYGFIDGFIGGWVIAWLYNKFA